MVWYTSRSELRRLLRQAIAGRRQSPARRRLQGPRACGGCTACGSPKRMRYLTRFPRETGAGTMSPPASTCQCGLQTNRRLAAAIGGATLAAWLGASVAAQPDNRQSEAIALARTTLAAKLSLPGEEITTVTVAAVQWRDSALGCPERGVVARPVVTSGFKVTLR